MGFEGGGWGVAYIMPRILFCPHFFLGLVWGTSTSFCELLAVISFNLFNIYPEGIRRMYIGRQMDLSGPGTDFKLKERKKAIYFSFFNF